MVRSVQGLPASVAGDPRQKVLAASILSLPDQTWRHRPQWKLPVIVNAAPPGATAPRPG